MVARTGRDQIRLWRPPTLLVDVAVAGDEDAGYNEDGEGVLVVEPEHEIIYPGWVATYPGQGGTYPGWRPGSLP